MLDGFDLPARVTWSVAIGTPHESPTFEHAPDVRCATASIGKILLLLTVAERIVDGALPSGLMCSRRSAHSVADSGIWQHLQVEKLPLPDVCVLVGAVSDNLATNMLLDVVGLDAVGSTAQALGLTRTGLHDLVRDERTGEHPPALSTGTARELLGLCAELAEPRTVDRRAAELVTGWLALDTDLSMVAAGFGLDPLAHVGEDRGVRVWNKTGTNSGVRCDVGTASFRSRRLSWAVLANWSVTDDRDETRDEVLTAMRAVGAAVRRELQETQCR